MKTEHEADKAAAIEEAVSAVECPVANVKMLQQILVF